MHKRPTGAQARGRDALSWEDERTRKEPGLAEVPYDTRDDTLFRSAMAKSPFFGRADCLQSEMPVQIGESANDRPET
jgi:hypothetical protein